LKHMMVCRFAKVVIQTTVDTWDSPSFLNKNTKMTVPYSIEEHSIVRNSLVEKSSRLFLTLSAYFSVNFQPNLIKYGEIKVVIIVIAATLAVERDS
jgi:hypothetical protein